MPATIFDSSIFRFLLRRPCRFCLWLCGWRMQGAPPDLPRYVLIAAPHTSNWDLFYMLLMAFAYGTQIQWMGKKQIFKRPFGPLMRWLGGIAIDRSKANSVVDQCIAVFNQSHRKIIAVPPEGTRRKTRYWKTGFYHIAHGAQIPIVMSFLDYKRKVGGYGPTFYPTGDIDADMKQIQAFYQHIEGKKPDHSGFGG